MGKMKENPRYNVLSVRIDDQLYVEAAKLFEGRTLSGYLREALEEKIIRDRQRATDEYLKTLTGCVCIQGECYPEGA